MKYLFLIFPALLVVVSSYLILRKHIPGLPTGNIDVTVYDADGKLFKDVSVQPMYHGTEQDGDPQKTDEKGHTLFERKKIGVDWKLKCTDPLGNVAWSDEFYVRNMQISYVEVHFSGDAKVKFYAESNSIPTPNVVIEVQQ